MTELARIWESRMTMVLCGDLFFVLDFELAIFPKFPIGWAHGMVLQRIESISARVSR